MTDSWQELLSTALVGTRRRALPPVTDGGPLGSLLTAVSDGDPATALLDRAAVHTAHQRAGAVAAAPTATVTTAPVDHRQAVSPAAAQRIAALLAGSGDRGLVGEWLALANTRDLVAPAELLPDLLELARQRPELREEVLRAGGPRGRWLAGLRPEWAQLVPGTDVPADDPAQWDEGTIAERVAYLTGLRQRDPAAAIVLLAQAWPDEPHAERTKLIEALRTGLGAADESFLEGALDDRRKEIRDRAAEMLCALPGSGLGQRMAARATQLVRAHRRVARPDVILVEPPTECDKAMRRDGIAAKAPQGVGERAFWLVEVIARTPLTAWTAGEAALAATPEAVLSLSVAGDFEAEWSRGLARAALGQGAVEWAGPLVDALGGSTNLPIEDRVVLEELFALLPPQERITRARAAFAESSAIGPVRAVELAPTPWPPTLADVVLGHIAAQVPKHRYSSRVSELCRLAETGFPPERAGDVQALATALATTHPDHHGVVDLRRLAATLNLRYDMQKEFA